MLDTKNFWFFLKILQTIVVKFFTRGCAVFVVVYQQGVQNMDVDTEVCNTEMPLATLGLFVFFFVDHWLNILFAFGTWTL